MLWFQRQTDEQFIDSLRRRHRRNSPLRLFFGVMGILTFVGFVVYVGLLDKILANIPMAYVGLAVGAMFGFVAMQMLLGGIVELMQCVQKGPINRTERLLLQFHDEVRSVREMATSPMQENAPTSGR